MAKKKITNKPVSQYRNGNLKSSIWENRVKKDRKPVLRNTISIQRSYKDAKSGEWVNYEVRQLSKELARLKMEN